LSQESFAVLEKKTVTATKTGVTVTKTVTVTKPDDNKPYCHKTGNGYVVSYGEGHAKHGDKPAEKDEYGNYTCKKY
jgi:hypothetical protein